MRQKQTLDYLKPNAVVSARMSKVKSKDTAPEMLVRKYLHGQGLRYRLNSTTLPGSPDVVLPKYRTAIFVHGCFWHQHAIGCGKKLTPKINVEYWQAKLKRNVQRDEESQKALRAAGWQVLVLWECELKSVVRGATLSRLTTAILGNELIWEMAEAEMHY